MFIRNGLLLNELIILDKKADCEFIVFKGAALILSGLYNISERQMSDIDIFIRYEDYDKFVELIKDMGYSKIDNGEKSFYKVVIDNFPPVIFDLHTSFFNLYYDDFNSVKLDGYKNLRLLCDEDMFLILAVHCILHHAFFDDKTKNDLKRIVDRNKERYEFFLKNIKNKAECYGCSYILKRILNSLGVDIKVSTRFRELISIPFVEISLKKHFVLNEYMLMLIYKPQKLTDFLKKPYKLRNILMRLLKKMD